MKQLEKFCVKTTHCPPKIQKTQNQSFSETGKINCNLQLANIRKERTQLKRKNKMS